ncbi:MAG: deacylase [Acidimicrobiales bacterium]|nr:MAG: deacylase [Acidimicrobiales bacterium]
MSAREPRPAVPVSDHFSPDYSTARERFRTAAAARGAALRSEPLSARGVDGNDLSVDVAYLGPEAPDCVLALSSGLHGVEGFAGSAIQHQLLAEQVDGLDRPAGCGLLLVHALNPFGFDGIRRVNENNVDLNRNFVAHPGGHVASADYEELYDAVNPVRMDDEEADAALLVQLIEFGVEQGFDRLHAALAVGQYLHPEGVQFGGQKEEESNLLVRELAFSETRGAARVCWIDVHTGLGDFGEVEMISESGTVAPDFQRASAWWGEAVQSTVSGDSSAPPVPGPIDAGLAEVLSDRELTAICAEFGTYDTTRSFAALRADNWLHQHGELDSDQGRGIKAELREVFCPDDRGWESSVLEIGARVVQEACTGLAVQ